MQHRGRIRVQLKNDDGTPFNSNFTTRESILHHLGDKIPLLKSRQSSNFSDTVPIQGFQKFSERKSQKCQNKNKKK